MMLTATAAKIKSKQMVTDHTCTTYQKFNQYKQSCTKCT